MSRILAVAHYYPPHVGGLEVVARETADGLHRLGHDVEVLTSALGGPRGWRDEGGVGVRRIPAWNGFERRMGVPFPVFAPSLLTAMWRMVGRADVVHIHDMLYLSSWTAALFSWARRRPTMVTMHVGMVDHPAWVVRAVQRVVHRTVGFLVMARAKRVMPISALIEKQLLAAVPGAASEVVANGVDAERYRPADAAERAAIRERHRLPVDEPLVLFVGRPVPKKGFDVVAAAGADSHRLVFVGFDRPEGRSADEQHIYLGPLPVEQVAEIYRCVDAFVCASVGEAPLTVLEAMASGVPVVLNDDPSLRELGVSSAAVSFLAMDPAALADRLRELAADPNLDKLRELAREEALTFHSRSAQVARLDQIVTEIEAGPRSVTRGRSPRR